MTTISLELLPPFLAVAELGSFSAAAGRLGVEKSSVSRAIARLEDAVGERLFLRTTRRVSLTDAGQSIRDRVRLPYESLGDAMRSVLQTAQSPRGRITLTAPADFCSVIVVEALNRLVRQYPHVEIDMRSTADYLDLVGSKIDVAIRFASKRLKDSTLRARKLGEAHIGIYASRAYVDARGLPRTLEEAKAQPWIRIRHVRELRVHGPDGSAPLPMEGRIVCDDMLFAQQAILRGLGLGMLPHFVAEQDVREGRLVQILPRWSVQTVSLWFLTLASTKPAPAIEALREALIEVMAARPTAFRMS